VAHYIGVLSAKILDGYGIPGTTPTFLDITDTETVAQLATLASDFVDALDPLTQGAITEVTLTLRLPGSGAAPDSGEGDIEKGALFNFANAITPYVLGVLVPDLDPAILTALGLIDLSNTDVQAFLSFLTTTHGAAVFVNKGLEALTGLADALITFRKHRKPLTRKTKEV